MVADQMRVRLVCRLSWVRFSHPAQDQDSLLVKRRNDSHSPGHVIKELVPSSHQRSELSNYQGQVGFLKKPSLAVYHF